MCALTHDDDNGATAPPPRYTAASSLPLAHPSSLSCKRTRIFNVYNRFFVSFANLLYLALRTRRRYVNTTVYYIPAGAQPRAAVPFASRFSSKWPTGLLDTPRRPVEYAKRPSKHSSRSNAGKLRAPNTHARASTRLPDATTINA